MTRVVKLIKVEAGANNNKFYDMEELSTGDFKVTWGRVGGTSATMNYPSRKWNSVYSSKLKKGYKDVTNLVAIEKKSFELNIKDNTAKKFIENLMTLSTGQVQENYLSSSATQVQIDAAQAILDKLLGITKLPELHDQLIELYTVIPRKMKSVKDNLPADFNTVNAIVSLEQDLLDNMSVTVLTQDVENIELLGLEIIPINKDEEKLIRTKLGTNSNQFVEGYRVIHHKTKDLFTSAVDTAENKYVDQLWHGSRNENWWSILNKGLVLRPTNAVISGKMFGYGTYFADKAQKSIGYCSLRNSYWARGSANYGILSLYNVHLGNQLILHSSDSGLNYQTLRSRGKYDSVFAKAGQSLINNEFIVYKEDQTTISYIVKIK